MSKTQRILIVDTETTGLDPERDSLLELGWADLADLSAAGSSFVKFDGRIPPEAQATHHIRQIDVLSAPPRKEVVDKLRALEPTLLVAHNAAFDQSMLPELEDYSWLCTWRCARHLWSQAPSHSLQVLRYWLGLEVETPPDLAPHRALYDVLVTRELLRLILSRHPLEELLKLQDMPVLLATVHFGKHKGMLWKDVPRDYLSWLLRQQDLDSDVRHTAQFHAGLL